MLNSGAFSALPNCDFLRFHLSCMTVGLWAPLVMHDDIPRVSHHSCMTVDLWAPWVMHDTVSCKTTSTGPRQGVQTVMHDGRPMSSVGYAWHGVMQHDIPKACRQSCMTLILSACRLRLCMTRCREAVCLLIPYCKTPLGQRMQRTYASHLNVMHNPCLVSPWCCFSYIGAH